MTLEDALADASRSGPFRLTLWPSSEGYQANLSTDGVGWRIEGAAEPVTALKKVLGLLPGCSGPLRKTSGPNEDVFS